MVTKEDLQETKQELSNNMGTEMDNLKEMSDEIGN